MKASDVKTVPDVIAALQGMQGQELVRTELLIDYEPDMIHSGGKTTGHKVVTIVLRGPANSVTLARGLDDGCLKPRRSLIPSD